MKAYIGQKQLILNCQKLFEKSRRSKIVPQKGANHQTYRSLKNYIQYNKKQFLDKKYLIHRRNFSLDTKTSNSVKKIEINFPNPKKKQNSLLMRKKTRCNSTDTSLSFDDRQTQSLNLSPKKQSQKPVQFLNTAVSYFMNSKFKMSKINQIKGLKTKNNLFQNGRVDLQQEFLCIVGSKIL